MEDKQQFLKLLTPVRRQLRIRRALLGLQYGFIAGAGVTMLIYFLARIVVLPFYHQFAIWITGLGFLVSAIWVWRGWPGWKDAVKVYNSYVAEDRVLSAFSFYKEDGMLHRLQLAEAVRWMRRVSDQVLGRKKKYQVSKWIIAGILFGSLAYAANELPSKKMEQAAMQETEKKILEKAEKELDKQIAKEKDPQAKKVLEELKKELVKAKTPEDALKALESKKKELALKEMKEEEKGNQIARNQEQLEKAGLTKLASALKEKDIEKAVQELSKLNQAAGQLNKEQKQALTQLTGKEGQMTEQELAQLAEKLKDALNSENALNQLASARAALSQQGQTVQKLMKDNGIPPGQIAMNPTTGTSQGQTPSGQKNGSSGQNGAQQPGNGTSPGQGNSQGNGNGSGHGNGSGTGNGNGNGTGTGTGTGTGSGNGGNGGNGTGSGAGLGQGSRDFLTVPEHIGGKTNVETDSGNLGSGSPASQYESDGPILRGTIRPYEEVYGSYADSYRTSMDRMNLPGGLETIVKNYFSDLDPNKE
ncbi:hypothetical protein A8F94_11310 [Bacillus sp. FJAT-27225]|uniref:coiled-coil domain-containing protein n=1 Tax=Bacillus sp. FJAT-27225 TaxID=1743144 RepID=UPI00080C35D2|nr:hypothetical protein [Bacillus sp. FJAT-27225]OCA85472.1 hypothetical protein A8F94_11310 [Bacillus sp. FJAT-27225]